MKWATFFLIAIVLLSTTVIGYAEITPTEVNPTETSLAKASESKEKKLGITFDLTYMSKYMSLGGEGFGQQGGLFETIDVDLWGSGFGIAIGHQSATSSGYVDKRRFNYNVYYKNSAFDGSAYKMDYKFNWRYEHYYDRARSVGNTQEWTLAFSWPDILPIENLTPYYIFDFEHPAGSNYNNNDISGSAHVFGLAYKWNVEQLTNPIKLSIDTTFRDGLGGGAVDHDWSHATLGISTKFNITDNLSFVPGLYHQITMDESVCKRDVTYCKLSLKYKF